MISSDTNIIQIMHSIAFLEGDTEEQHIAQTVVQMAPLLLITICTSCKDLGMPYCGAI